MPPVCQVNNVNIDLVFSNSIEENIISINSKKELFFDVYECMLNEEKLILEKVGESELGPKVLLELNIDGKKYSAEAILVDNGSTYVELDKENIYSIITIPESNLFEKDEIEEPIIDNTSAEVNTLIDIETMTRYNEDKLQEKITNYTNIYQSRLDEFENKKKEFLSVIDKEFEDRVNTINEELDVKLYDFFKLNEQDSKFLVFNEAEKLRESVSDISEKFKLELKNVKEFSKENVNHIIDNKSKEIYEKIYQHTDKLIEQNKQTISENINNLSNLFTKELNELKLLKDKIPATDPNIIKSQNKKFKSILEHVNSEFNQLNKKVKLISESKNDEYNQLLAAVNNKEVVEYKTILREKIETAELNSVKSELLNELNGNIQNEVQGMRRYAQMSAGGGTNAVQYAKGGTMDGNLNVTGELKADTIIATSLLSAGTMDINFELSGFSVTGDISANGNLYVTENINLSGDLFVEGLVDGRDIAADGAAIDNLNTDVIFLSGKIDNLDADVIFLSGAIDNTDLDVNFLSGAIDNTDADVIFLSGAIDLKANIASPTFTGSISAGGYTSISRSEDVSPLNPIQNNQPGNNLDTVANLCVDPSGNVVRGSQEATWTFTRDQLNALTASKVTLLSAPGAGKCIVVEESNWLIEVDLTKAAQSTPVTLVCEIVNGQTQYKVATQITAANLTLIAGHIKTANTDTFGMYSRDVPELDRISKFNEPMTIRAKGATAGNDFPDNFASVRLKIKYRVFDKDTF